MNASKVLVTRIQVVIEVVTAKHFLNMVGKTTKKSGTSEESASYHIVCMEVNIPFVFLF